MTIVYPLALLAITVLIALAALRKRLNAIAFVCIGLGLTYEAIGILLWIGKLVGLMQGNHLEIKTTFVSIGTSEGVKNLVSGGANTALILIAVGTYLLCAITMVALAITTLRNYRPEHPFHPKFQQNLQRLAWTLLAGGVITVIVQATCEIIWAFETPSSSAPSLGYASSFPNGAAWIVPGAIVMLLPAVVKRGMEMKDEVDYLV